MPNLLSIQSWVAFGHVGNAAAIFPLQRLGFDVWGIHTVQFSNHTGYGAWRGRAFDSAWIGEVVEGLNERGVLSSCDGVLSGYLGQTAMGLEVLSAAQKVRHANPAALFCCDPVMGDIGRGFFVKAELGELFRDRLVREADIVTPNHFELEFLSGRTVETLAQALDAVDQVRAAGPGIVLVTSLRRENAPANCVELLAVGPEGAYLVSTPLLKVKAHGAGDVTAALFLAHMVLTRNVAAAAETAASAIHAILAETARRGSQELSLVEAQDEIVAPRVRFTAQKVR